MSILRSMNTWIDRWLTAPEVNAAGRMGLFRIVYGLFYLWTTRPLSYFWVWMEIPQDQWSPILTARRLQLGRPDPVLFEIMPVIMLVSLVLLIIGFRTRLATLFVLVSGIFLWGTYYSFTGKVDHADTFLVAYIPAIMLFSRWGSTYSLDTVLKARRGQSVNPRTDTWQYIWPMRAVLLLTALMFFGAGYYKLRGGQWLTDMDLFPRLLLSQNAITAVNSTPNPLNPIIAGIPLIHVPLQFGGILFELLFPLVLFNRIVRNLFVSAGLLFHAFNLYLLGINASPMIIMYLTFVDWQAVYDRWWPLKSSTHLQRLSSPVLVGLTLALAAIVPFLWQDVNLIRPPLGQALLSPVSIWYVVTPIALFALVKAVYDLVRTVIPQNIQRLRPQAIAQD
jgi:hypothetical protein